MIKGTVGGVGSGKTISLVRDAVTHPRPTLTNFQIFHPKVTRLKKDDIIITTENEKGKKELRVNWEFWEGKENTNLFLDEVHNLLNSRNSMHSWNKTMQVFFSQCRKLLSDKEDTDFHVISQRIDRIDISLRDLMHEIKHCQSYVQMEVGGKWVTIDQWKYRNNQRFHKYPLRTIPTLVRNKDNKIIKKDLPVLLIMVTCFEGEFCVDQYQRWLYEKSKIWSNKYFFVGNTYFKYYNTHEKVKYGEEVYL